MKGMNSTLILNEPDNQQAPDTLKSIFNDSCSRHGVPDSQKETLIKNGIGLFEMNTTGDIFPLNSYQTIAEYILKHRDDIVQADDSTKATKEQLYNQLAKAASSSNMPKYRRLRKQYSALL